MTTKPKPPALSPAALDEAPGTLTEALVVLQSQLPVIKKTATGQIQSRTYAYADLAAITPELFPLMTSLGLAFTATPRVTDDGRFVLAYQLRHIKGDQIEGSYPLPTTGTNQQIGSAITYARRYCLCAVTGLAPEDDDDDAASAPAVTGELVQGTVPPAPTPMEQAKADLQEATRRWRSPVDQVAKLFYEKHGHVVNDGTPDEIQRFIEQVDAETNESGYGG